MEECPAAEQYDMAVIVSNRVVSPCISVLSYLLPVVTLSMRKHAFARLCIRAVIAPICSIGSICRMVWALFLLVRMDLCAAARRHNVPLIPPSPPPAAPLSPSRPPIGEGVICVQYPAVKAVGGQLLLNNPADKYDTRFFLAGWVGSGGSPLTSYNRTHMEMLLQDSRALGATAFRWNAFLKGLDFEWETEPIPQDRAKRFDQRHIVKGLKPGCMEVIREVADLAAEYGLLLQVVLSTAHFFRFGYGGADFELQGISNRQRVSNLHHMLTDEAAMRAYFVRVVEPLTNILQNHPALLGFLLVNEGYSMVNKEDKIMPTETDATMSLHDLQRFINRLAGTIRRQLPQALLSASLKLKKNSRWDDRTGKTSLALWYSDHALVSAGGDEDGTLDLRQYQYYPEGASGEDESPFLNSAATLRISHEQTDLKPSLVGEFPLEGIARAEHSPTAFDLKEAYDTLWHLGYSGGFTWMAERYYQMTPSERAAVADAYSHVRELLGGFRLQLSSVPCPSPPPPKLSPAPSPPSPSPVVPPHGPWASPFRSPPCDTNQPSFLYLTPEPSSSTEHLTSSPLPLAIAVARPSLPVVSSPPYLLPPYKHVEDEYNARSYVADNQNAGILDQPTANVLNGSSAKLSGLLEFNRYIEAWVLASLRDSKWPTLASWYGMLQVYLLAGGATFFFFVLLRKCMHPRQRYTRVDVRAEEEAIPTRQSRGKQSAEKKCSVERDGAKHRIATSSKRSNVASHCCSAAEPAHVTVPLQRSTGCPHDSEMDV